MAERSPSACTAIRIAILRRIKREKIAYGCAPLSLEDGELNNWNGGRGVYFRDPNGHVLELMTVPQ